MTVAFFSFVVVAAAVDAAALCLVTINHNRVLKLESRDEAEIQGCFVSLVCFGRSILFFFIEGYN